MNRDEPGDEADAKYARAARFLKNWQKEGVLKKNAQPCIYVYHQTFDYEGARTTRRGFIAKTRLEPFGTGNIFPHEETHSRAKVDRLKLFNATKANLSPIFGIYPDQENVAQEILQNAIMGMTALQATDHLGVLHEMWTVTDVQVISQVVEAMGDKPIFIADGHHRYETGCDYQSQLDESGELTAEHPANYCLMMNVSMHDQGMIVLPTHRMFRGIPEFSSEEIAERLGEYFSVKPMGSGSAIGHDVWEHVVVEGNQGGIGLFTEKDQQWNLVQVNEAGLKRLSELETDRSEQWCGLGVSILHRLIIDELLGAEGHPTPKYVHSVEEVIDGIENGDGVGRDATGQQGSGGKFPLVALVMPASLGHIEASSKNGERMPAKSTYFYPKLLSGLVLNSLEK